jgi:myo-inositol 2-dehydrogenase/D-chiro-inositol 1-dehydrogenase
MEEGKTYMMKIGIIGGGNMGVTHGKLINGNDKLSLAAVYDTSREKGEAAAKILDTRFIDDIDTFLNNIDMAFVTVPNTFHAALAIQVLEKGKHVFVEKPLATSLADAEAVAAAAKKSGKRVFVGYNRRFAPVYMRLKELIQADGFQPVNINIIQNDGDMINPPWLTDIKMTGGFMYDTTVHFLDMARYLLGDVKELRALGKAAFYPIIDDFVVMLTFESGAMGVISTCGHASWISPFERVQVVGDHKSVITEELDVLSYSPGLDAVIEGTNYSKLPYDQKWGYAKMHAHMFDCLENGKTAQNEINEGYQCVRLIEACYASAAANGETIKF